MLKFHVSLIYPADEPTTASIYNYGLSLLLVESGLDDTGTILISCDEKSAYFEVAPIGTTVKITHDTNPFDLPGVKPALEVVLME